MNDGELRELISTLDVVEPAPRDMVERVWADVESLLASEPAESSPVLPPTVEAGDDVSVADFGPRQGRIWLAVAAVVVVVGLGLLSLVGGGDPRPVVSDQPGPAIDLPATAPAAAPPPTLETACAAFRISVAEAGALEAEGFVDDVDAIAPWIDAVDDLIAAVDAGGLLDEAADDRLDLRLLLTALRSVEISIADGAVADAATAVANSIGLRDGLASSGSPLESCFTP